MTVAQPDAILLEGVRVHNLKAINLAIPLHKLTVFTGVSGSGKSSLAFDTLYAEGQRRYIESFSPYARQFLERLDQPDADRIDNLPPAVALRQNSVAPGKRSTLATATEVYDYLRLLYGRAGTIIDPATGHPIIRDTPGTAAAALAAVPHGRKLLICFPADALPQADPDAPSAAARLADALLERGYTRAIVGETLVTLGRGAGSDSLDAMALVVTDRLTSGRTPQRLAESLEAAFTVGDGRCVVFSEGDSADATNAAATTLGGRAATLDGVRWTRLSFDGRLVSPTTGQEFIEPTPALFSFHSPLGACPTCRGFGRVAAMDWDKIVPDPSKTVAEGAIACWTTPAYRHELDELLALAPDYNLPTDRPFAELTPTQRALIHDGVKSRKFGGLRGFFRWLERKRYKIGIAALLARYRSYEICPDCNGTRLNPAALTVQWHGRTVAELCALTVADALPLFDAAVPADDAVGRAILPQLRNRLATLDALGLGYLTLDRTTDSLSGGEARRVALTAAFGAGLVNMLYVLDEPTTGLHPRDRQRVLDTLTALRDAPNTVVVVEHDPTFLEAADFVVDLGPGAGRDGGRVLYAGPPQGLRDQPDSATARMLASGGQMPFELSRVEIDFDKPRTTLTLTNCTRHNLKNLTVAFPMNALCVVSGVSGSGKSTLVTETLYPAVCRALGKTCDTSDADRSATLTGAESLGDVILIDQSPIGRTPRSNPATYLGVFDAIRAAFAATPEAKLRRFTPGTFSFNAARGGRCPHCEGAGVVTIDMQFLPDVAVTCPECGGSRFRSDVLDVKLAGKNVAEVLAMTAAEAFAFFRGHSKVQKRLAILKEVGLDYLPLGQPATTLSGGESQRLKIAAFLSQKTGTPTLFLFDEPTVGLHAADVVVLLECLRRLIAVGHSIVIVEHRLDVIAAADWIIDLGPEAGAAGGEIVAAGPPAEVAATAASVTGGFLR